MPAMPAADRTIPPWPLHARGQPSSSSSIDTFTANTAKIPFYRHALPF
jgi:hypothetical protein